LDASKAIAQPSAGQRKRCIGVFLSRDDRRSSALAIVRAASMLMSISQINSRRQ
jgi:hypothetical protein